MFRSSGIRFLLSIGHIYEIFNQGVTSYLTPMSQYLVGFSSKLIVKSFGSAVCHLVRTFICLVISKDLRHQAKFSLPLLFASRPYRPGLSNVNLI